MTRQLLSWPMFSSIVLKRIHKSFSFLFFPFFFFPHSIFIAASLLNDIQFIATIVDVYTHDLQVAQNS